MIELFGQNIRTNRRQSSKGNQLKWENDGIWYKADYTGYEGLAEYMISHLLKKSTLAEQEFVYYDLEEIKYGTVIYNGAKSKNFLNEDWQIITLERLFHNFFGESLYKSMYRIPDHEERLRFLVQQVERMTGLQNFGVYMNKLLTIDAFFLNEDRHMHNIAVLMNGKGDYAYCPIFDNGAGLLADTTMDYPLTGDIYTLMEKVQPKTICNAFDEQLDISESLYKMNLKFRFTGYNVFVLEYTINQLDEAALKMQPLHDISRAIRMIRSRAEEFHIRPDRIAVCGFSAGAHLCGSLCVHNKDVEDPEEAYQNISNRPDAAILSYPVITSGKYAHRDSFVALFGKEPSEQELDYMSLENHVTKDTPPCFLWQTVTDQTVPVENSYLFAQACAQAGVPFAQHVFSEGIHGLSVATEEWLEQNIGQEEGKRYTQEQVQMLAEAIEAGETPFPKEKGEKLLVKFGIGRKKPARWTEKQKEGIRKTLKEVQSWTQLAEVWMEKYLKVE